MTGLGEQLKKERELKNVSIEEIAKITHLNPRLLEAMERNDFSQIPGVFYAKNFLKTYLKAVGANQEVFFKEHRREIQDILEGKKNDPVQYYSKLRYSSFKKRNLFLTASVLLILIVSIFCFFYRSKANLFQVVDFSKQGAEAQEVTGGKTPFLNANLLAGIDARDFSYDRSPIDVRIEFLDKCWIQVVRGGKAVTSSVFEQGTVQIFKGYDLILTLGNPAGLRLFVNGAEITRFKNSNRSLRVQLNPAKLENFLKNE